MDHSNLAQLVLANLVMAGACALQSVVGFGAALTAAPVLALLDAHYVPGPLLVAGSVLAAAMMLRERHAVDRRGLGWAVGGRVPGAVLGAHLVASVPKPLAASLFAGLILLAVGLTLLGSRMPRITPSPKTSLAAGFISGVMGTVTSVGGPPLALLYQHESGPTLRSTLASYFLVGSIISTSSLALFGELGMSDVLQGASIVPGLLAGFFGTRRFHTALDRGHTRTAVLAVSALSALLVLMRTWW